MRVEEPWDAEPMEEGTAAAAVAPDPGDPEVVGISLVSIGYTRVSTSMQTTPHRLDPQYRLSFPPQVFFGGAFHALDGWMNG